MRDLVRSQRLGQDLQGCGLRPLIAVAAVEPQLVAALDDLQAVELWLVQPASLAAGPPRG
jgi:hypothetical protein